MFAKIKWKLVIEVVGIAIAKVKITEILHGVWQGAIIAEMRCAYRLLYWPYRSFSSFHPKTFCRDFGLLR
jgi:hypothetical protein